MKQCNYIDVGSFSKFSSHLLVPEMPVVQTIVIRYLDKQKLSSLLEKLWPNFDYECDVRLPPHPNLCENFSVFLLEVQIKENNVEPTVTLRRIPRELTAVSDPSVLCSDETRSLLNRPRKRYTASNALSPKTSRIMVAGRDQQGFSNINSGYLYMP